MAYTEGVVNVKDASGASTPIDAALVTNTSTTEPAVGSTAGRQIMAIGDATTPANVAGVDTNLNLQTMARQFKTTVIETSATLGSNAVFTSAWYDSQIDGTLWVAIESYADKSAASCIIQQTNDTGNANLSTSSNNFNTPGANSLFQYGWPITYRYWRIVYTNNATAQTTFELTSTRLSFIPQKTSANLETPANGGGYSVLVSQGYPSFWNVNGQGITKGVQNTNGGFHVQEIKDAGRNPIYMGATQVTGIVSESVITCNITKGQAAQTAASTYTVTSGKTLRIQSIRYGVSGAVGVATIRLRVTSVSGAVLWEDSLVYGATTLNQASETQNFPDGYELSAGTVINWTMACASTSQKIDVALVAYEY